MISVAVNDADKIAGLANLNSALMQRILDLEINLAAAKRVLSLPKVQAAVAAAEKEIADAGQGGEKNGKAAVQDRGEGNREGEGHKK